MHFACYKINKCNICLLRDILNDFAMQHIEQEILLRHYFSLQWRHNGHESVSNQNPHHCLLNRLFGRRSKKTSKLRVTGLCAGTSPGTGEFPAEMPSNAENVSICFRHHQIKIDINFCTPLLIFSVQTRMKVIKMYIECMQPFDFW